MTIEIIYGVVLFLLFVCICALALAVREMEKKINRLDAVVTSGLAKMAQAVSDVVDTTTSLSDKLEEFEVDPVSKKIDEAKTEILSEWITNITEYTPWKGTPHRGE